MVNLRNIIKSAIIAGSLLFNPIKSLSEPVEIFNKTYSVEMNYDNGKIVPENFNVRASYK